MKFWLARKVQEVRLGESLDAVIERETSPENLRYEVKDESGKWTEVQDSYFNSERAKILSEA